jgi:hypothetical protein
MERKNLEFICDWFDEWSAKPPVYGWASELLDDKIRHAPEDAWLLIVELIDKAPGNEALVWVAAGPLEDLLCDQGHAFIERVEQFAQSNDRFRKCLGSVRGQNRMASEIYSRMRRSSTATEF